MTDDDMETRHMTAAAVPLWAIKRVAMAMRAAGIPVTQTNVIKYSIGLAAGITDAELSEFTTNRRPRRVSDFNRELENA